MADSVLTLIDSTKWRSALFTSFTLSLTYLESHVLPKLRKQGCQSLTVLADVAGYRDSLMEQRARAVGRDYAVVPVSVAGGIFHPKLVHLWALEGDEDLLLVGSGNLTYPGHGGNVEVLEALRPAAHASAFRQASEFFDRLAQTSRVSVADTKALLQTSKRLLDVASRGADTEAVRFIDSLDSSGLKQMLAQAREIAYKWDELLVLSPYHHPEAKPVEKLLTELGIQRLVVGVSTKLEGCAFPFDAAQEFGLESLIAQMPVAEKGTRRALHAKWFEIRRPGAALVLSGSFNATNESFASTRNVECGVLRLLHEGTAAMWVDTPIPVYVRGEFPARDGAADLCLFASFDSPSRMVGSFIGNGNVEGPWEARLENVERILANDVVQVDEKGGFCWRVPCSVDEATSHALQVIFTRDSQQARGWVQVRRVLNMRSADRVLLQSLAQLANDTHEVDDAQAVLDYIVGEFGNLVQASTTSPLMPSQSGNSDHGSTGSPDGASLSAQEFEALTDPWGLPPRYDSGLLLDSLDAGRHGWDLLQHICTALMALPAIGRKKDVSRDRGSNDWGGFGSTSSISVEDEGDAVEQRRLEAQLARARDEFTRHLEAAELALLIARSPEARQAIELGRSRMLLLASWVEIRFRLLKLGDSEAAQVQLWQWFRLTCDLQLGREQKQHLDRQVCGIAAASALWLLETKWLPNDLGRSPKQVHRLLERYFAAQLDRDEVCRQATAWLEEPAGLMLTQRRTVNSIVALQEVLSEPTERQVLAKVLRDGFVAHRSLAEKVFDKSHLQALEKISKEHTAARPRYSLVDLRQLIGCPNCNISLTRVRPRDGYHELNREVSWQLRQYGFVKCPEENYYLVAKEVS